MSETDDVTAGGSRIIDYGRGPRGLLLRLFGLWRGSVSTVATSGAREIERHCATHFGEPSTVFHETASELVHIDVHVIRPRPDRNHWTLFTTGMSDRPMLTREPDETRFAELVLSLPPEWRVDLLRMVPPTDDLEQWYWPIRWMKVLARMPHQSRTSLSPCDTVPNGDPARPFAPGTMACCWWLLTPNSIPEEARQVTLTDGRTVTLLTLHALHPDEMRFKLDRGSDALLQVFDRANVSEVLTLSRPPVTS